jgi:hypothetical protein
MIGSPNKSLPVVQCAVLVLGTVVRVISHHRFVFDDDD